MGVCGVWGVFGGGGYQVGCWPAVLASAGKHAGSVPPWKPHEAPPGNRREAMRSGRKRAPANALLPLEARARWAPTGPCRLPPSNLETHNAYPQGVPPLPASCPPLYPMVQAPPVMKPAHTQLPLDARAQGPPTGPRRLPPPTLVSDGPGAPRDEDDGGARAAAPPFLARQEDVQPVARLWAGGRTPRYPTCAVEPEEPEAESLWARSSGRQLAVRAAGRGGAGAGAGRWAGRQGGATSWVRACSRGCRRGRCADLRASRASTMPQPSYCCCVCGRGRWPACQPSSSPPAVGQQ